MLTMTLCKFVLAWLITLQCKYTYNTCKLNMLNTSTVTKIVCITYVKYKKLVLFDKYIVAFKWELTDTVTV